MLHAKLAFVLALGLSNLGVVRADAPPQSSPSEATQKESESWRKEFDEICSKTDDAMTFSEDELASLIRRCDALAPQLEKLEESKKKVFLGRLRMCRGLYAYVLDSKKEKK